MKEIWKCRNCEFEWTIETPYVEAMKIVGVLCPNCGSIKITRGNVKTTKQGEEKMDKTYTIWIACKNCGLLFLKYIPHGVNLEEQHPYPLYERMGLAYFDKTDISYKFIECPECGSQEVHKWKVGWPKPKAEFPGLKRLAETSYWAKPRYLDLLDFETRDRILRSIQLTLEIEPLFRCAENLEQLAKDIREEAGAKRKKILGEEENDRV